MPNSRAALAGGIVALLLAVGVHLAMLESTRSGRLNGGYDDSSHRKGQAVDFFTVYWGSRQGLAGRSLYRYDLPHGAAPGEPPYAYSNFRYFPGFAFSVGYLLTRLEPWPSYWLWLGITELLCLLGAVWAFRLSKAWGAGGALALWIAALWLGFTPYYLELFMGQFTLPLAVLILLLLHRAHQRRYGALGRAWVLSLLWKFATVLHVPLYHRLRRWRTLWAGAAAVAVFTVPYFVVHPSDAAHFARYFAMGFGARPHAGNHGIQTLLSLVPDALWPDRLMLHWGGQTLPPWRGALLGATLGLVWLAWRRTLSGRDEPAIIVCLWTAMYFAISRDVWEHHTLLLLPVLTYLLATLPHRRTGLALAALFLALPTPFRFLDVPGLPPEVDPEPLWSLGTRLLYHADKALPELWILWVCYRELEEPPPGVTAPLAPRP